MSDTCHACNCRRSEVTITDSINQLGRKVAATVAATSDYGQMGKAVVEHIRSHFKPGDIFDTKETV